MEFITGVAVGVVGLAAWRAISDTAVKGGTAAVGTARDAAGAVRQRVTDVVDLVRPEPPTAGSEASDEAAAQSNAAAAV